MLTKAPRGTYDSLPGRVEQHQYIEQLFQEVAETFGYGEVRTPVFEHTDLFKRGVGETTDIVQKEMYTFDDRGGRSITLRPEGTAPVVRAFIEHKLYGQALPCRLYYKAIPILRYERPQAGRLRQHHQFGVEIFGADDPRVDVEVMDLLNTFYKRLGLKQTQLFINSVGCPECRPVHRQALQDYLADVYDELCETCQDRYHRNPMRILDCKNPTCRKLTAEAPVMKDYLCDSCADSYSKVKKGLELIELPYFEDSRLVRGLDYYTNTAFEFCNDALSGAIKVIGGGGRYNGLIEELGGPAMGGIGFGCGLERVELACEAENIQFPVKKYCQVYIVNATENAQDLGLKVVHNLRVAGIAADTDYLGRSMKAQMKQAGRLEAEYVVIIGDEEMQNDTLILRNMAEGSQQVISHSELLTYLRNE